MKIQLAIFIVGVCCSLSIADAQNTGTCVIPQCFNCTLCELDCGTEAVAEDCDSGCLTNARKFVCELERENCMQISGCNIPSSYVEIYPAANYATYIRQWAPKRVDMRPNCCYNLNNPEWQPWYDNTLSGLKKQLNTCVILYDGLDCTGTSLRVDSTWQPAQLQWIDHTSRTGPPANGILFNDKTSSMRLC